MKIAMILRRYSKSGSARYAVETSKYFVRDGHDVHVFANEWENMDGITFHKIPTFSSKFFLREGIFNLYATLNLKKHSFDVKYSQPSRFFTPDVAGVHICFKSWADLRRRNGFSVDFKERFLHSIEGRNLRNSKIIAAVSNRIKGEIIKFHDIPNNKIHVIYDGVNLDDFHPRNKKYSEEIRKRHGIREDDLVLLFVGNPFTLKGLYFLVEAIPMLNENVKLLAIGKDEFPQKLISELGLTKSVISVGLSHEVQKYLGTCDVFVLPTLYDGFSLVTLEAMASGLPVIVSKIAGASEIINENEDGLLLKNPKNPNEIAEKINSLIGNDSLRKRMGRRARKKAEKFSWETTANKMLKVFEEIT